MLNKNIRKKSANRKRKVDKRTQKRNWSDQPKPMMAGRNIFYDVDGRHQAISYGGIGVIHQLATDAGGYSQIPEVASTLKRFCSTNAITILTDGEVEVTIYNHIQ